jgi:hypothetical protein
MGLNRYWNHGSYKANPYIRRHDLKGKLNGTSN